MNFIKILYNLFSILITNTFFISLFKIINKIFYNLNYFNLIKYYFIKNILIFHIHFLFNKFIYHIKIKKKLNKYNLIYFH